jgi:hypothetical protein
MFNVSVIAFDVNSAAFECYITSNVRQHVRAYDDKNMAKIHVMCTVTLKT